MSELDKLVTEDFVSFREHIIDDLQAKHPQMFSIINFILSKRQNKIGMQVLENEKIAGEYTFQLEGIRIIKAVPGKLESEVHHPLLGVIKPFVIVEKTTLQNMLSDEQSFAADLFAVISKYLPYMTIKFMH